MCVQNDPVPYALKCRAVDHLMQLDRADEELIQLAEDVRAAAKHYTDIYSKLTVTAASDMCTGMRALLLQKLNSLSVPMTGVWAAAEKLGIDIGVLPNFEFVSSDTVIDSEGAECYYEEEDSESEVEAADEMEEQEEN